jgi:multicomponent K+:H+ antiporter subunit G
MTPAAALPDWAAWLTAVLVLAGAGLALTGSIGLLRLRRFYDRVHAPTLGATLGTGAILVASMVCASVLHNRPVVHEILIALFVTVTTPVTLMLLVRATFDRTSRGEGDAAPQQPAGSNESGPGDRQ